MPRKGAPPKAKEQIQDNESDYEGEDQLDETEMKRTKKVYCCSRHRGWASFIVNAVYLVEIDVNNLPNLLIWDYQSLVDQGQLNLQPQIVRWSMWLSASWMSIVMFWHFLKIAPMLCVSFISAIYGEVSEKWRTNLGHLPSVKYQMALAFGSVFVLMYFFIVFAQFLLVPYWLAIAQTLMLLDVLCILLFLQKLFIISVAINFHNVAYSDRIEASKASNKILETLKLSIKHFALANMFDAHSSQNTQRVNFKPDVKIDLENSVMKTSSTSKLEREGTDEKRDDSGSPVGAAPSISNSEFKDSSIKIGGSSYKKTMKTLSLISDKNAINLSKKLWRSLNDSSDITIATFYQCFESVETAKEAFALFDPDATGYIDEKALRRGIKKIYRERRNLLKSLRDVSQALGNFNRLIYGFVLLLTGLFSLPIFGINLNTVLPFTSIIIALSFVFGTQAKTTFESIIFLFVTHPYDIGDRVVIKGVTMIVEEIHLLTTVFRRTGDGQKLYVPTSTLVSEPIGNIRRSADQSDEISFTVDFETPHEVLVELETKVKEFVASQSKDFISIGSLNIKEMQHTHLLVCSFFVTFKGNFQDGSRRMARRNMLMYEIKKYMVELWKKYDLKFFRQM
ncbi:hypothetical protein HK103_001378 [Boothiomyces macroporosus]|uniref:EF-hand domain-containing protein n=1 Tax=Boothiomyces macroporosus TaxID=261099 RepID=A0AAD5UAX1_9FUNG|nr:hypothetical protein HK103_001378 [Boothiomyces macroporosus]